VVFFKHFLFQIFLTVRLRGNEVHPWPTGLAPRGANLCVTHPMAAGWRMLDDASNLPWPYGIRKGFCRHRVGEAWCIC
jgi:hypothetical protein